MISIVIGSVVLIVVGTVQLYSKLKDFNNTGGMY